MMQRSFKSGLLALLGAGAILGSTLLETGCTKEEEQKKKTLNNVLQNASSEEKPKASQKQTGIAKAQRFYFNGNWNEPSNHSISPFGINGKVYSDYGASKDQLARTELNIRCDTGIALDRTVLASGEEVKYSYTAYVVSTEPLSFQNRQIKDVTKEKAEELEETFYIGNLEEIKRKLFVYEVGKSKPDSKTRDSLSFALTEKCSAEKQSSPARDIETRLIVDYELKRGEQVQRIATTSSPQVGIPPYIPELIGKWRAEEGNMTLDFKEYGATIGGDTPKVYGSKDLLLHKGKIYLEGVERGPRLEFSLSNPPKMKYFPQKGSSDKPRVLIKQ